MEIFSKDQLSALKSMSSYWTEILKQDEPRKTASCINEINTIYNTLSPAQIITLINKGLEAIVQS